MLRLPKLEWGWLIPAILCTLANGLVASSMLSSSSHYLTGLQLLPVWMLMVVLFIAFQFFAQSFLLSLRGKQEDVLPPRDWLLAHYPNPGRLLLFMFIAGANMVAFLWIKPVLNIAIPFTADPLLADLDYALFLGNDPWTLIGWVNFEHANQLYHPIWFVLMIIALMILFAAPSSAKKSAMALSYFLLWSIIGPLVHYLLPAGGPVFFERLGYGQRFVELDGGERTAMVSDMLWHFYSTGQFQPTAGISAMPSMHVTMSMWTVLCFIYFKPRWAALVGIVSFYIALLSVALGWHYAVDGIAGAILACATFLLCVKLFERFSPADQAG